MPQFLIHSLSNLYSQLCLSQSQKRVLNKQRSKRNRIKKGVDKQRSKRNRIKKGADKQRSKRNRIKKGVDKQRSKSNKTFLKRLQWRKEPILAYATCKSMNEFVRDIVMDPFLCSYTWACKKQHTMLDLRHT